MEQQALGRVLGRAFRSSQVRLVLFFLLTWLAIACLVVFLLLEGRRQAERGAEAEVSAISAILEARLSGAFQRVQAALEHLAITLPVDALEYAFVEHFRNGVVRELGFHARQFPEVDSFRILDAEGQLLYASRGRPDGGDFSDRSYFKAFDHGAGNGLFFSEVQTDRLTSRPALNVAVPVRTESGGLRAVIVAQLDLAYLSSWFESVGVGGNGVVSLRRAEDGSVILRRPFVAGLVNQPLTNNVLQSQLEGGARSGTLRMSAAVDGVERMYGFRRLGDYPLYVTAGRATVDYLAEWWHAAWLAGLVGLLLFLVMLLVLVRFLREVGQEAAAGWRVRESEARYRMLAENTRDVIWTVDIPTRCYTYVSPSISEMTGYSPAEVVGQPFDARLTPDSAARLAREIDLGLRRIAAGDRAGNVLVSEFDQICKDGTQISTEVVSSYLLDEDGVVRTILGIARNISERKAAEQALRESNRQLHARIEEIGRLQVALQELAVRDSLTGLYNRRYLDETLDREVSRARREGNPLSLVMIDIDYFKRVNDTYGHQVGDEVLRTLAATLSTDIRAEDVACRYGGEEFLILLPNMPLETAILRAEAWRAAVERLSIAHGNFELTFTISLGVSAYPDQGKTPDDLTRCADQALYQAKHEGRNRVSMHCD
ncbi:MAG: diguanylate cyclase [Betaproteobacteria bacterium]|nr:diguanylate cyclase [Betaproteobacteria bacterium]